MRAKRRASSAKLPAISPDEVVIQVAYAGVSPTDLAFANGSNGDSNKKFGYPIVPGGDYSGIVVEAGAKVNSLRKGHKVAGMPKMQQSSSGEIGCGAYAQYLVAEASELYKLPLEMPLKHGPLVRSVATCLEGLRGLGVERGQHASASISVYRFSAPFG